MPLFQKRLVQCVTDPSLLYENKIIERISIQDQAADKNQGGYYSALNSVQIEIYVQIKLQCLFSLSRESID